MGKHKKQIFDKDLLIGREIPSDLIPDILLRLPAKSVARFRCVSKQWGSILHTPHFTEMFLTVSLTRPRLLFALQYNGKWFFLSAPQPLNPDQNSSPLVVDYHKRVPSYFSSDMCVPVHGLICTNSVKPMICNPSTSQYIALPRVESVGSKVRTFIGYDPINNIYKVLSLYYGSYRVLTLGKGELSWRKIECSIPHAPPLSGGNGICINGFLYYLPHCHGRGYPNLSTVVCFDVRFEKFKFLDVGFDTWRSTLVNFQGRLGVLHWYLSFTVGEQTRMDLFVLDDADEEKWSKHTYDLPPLPPLWCDLRADVAMTCTGEFVVSPCYTLSDPFSIFYYNLERNTLV